jgi:arginase family enzyme
MKKRIFGSSFFKEIRDLLTGTVSSGKVVGFDLVEVKLPAPAYPARGGTGHVPVNPFLDAVGLTQSPAV